jgi:hypothetical protein
MPQQTTMDLTEVDVAPHPGETSGARLAQ